MSDKNKQKEEYYKNHNYTDSTPIYVDKDSLNQEQTDKLTKSKVFCILPWIHLHAFPNGQAYPCCLSDSHYPVGNLHNNTMKEVWNSDEYKQMRHNMMNVQNVMSVSNMDSLVCVTIAIRILGIILIY